MEYSSAMDYERLACEFMRGLRGRRSQTALSRRLGRKSNVAYAWESGKRHPTAAEAMRVAAITGHDLREATASFYSIHVPELEPHDLQQPEQMAALLRALQGSTSVTELARRCRKGRHVVARWLSGETTIRLPDFFRFLQEGSRSALTFISGFVSPATLPSAREQWSRVQAMGTFLLERPETLLLFVGVALAGYQSLSRHEPGWLASRLGLTEEQEREGLRALARAGVIAWNGRRWEIDDAAELDTRRYPDAALEIKRYFAQVGLDQIAAPSSRFRYVLLSLEEQELEQLYVMQREFIQRVRALAAKERTPARVAVVAVHIVPLGDA